MGADETTPLLGPLGLSDIEERVYRRLLRLNGGSLAEVTRSSEIPERPGRQALASLEARGLLTRSTRRPKVYVPAPPHAAIDLLVHRRQEELEKMRLAANELAAEVGKEALRADTTEIVEVVARGEGVSIRNYQLLMGAQQEVLGFSVPPLDKPDDRFIQFKLDLLGRGVTAKAIYTPEVLEAPERLRFIEAVRPAGEESRLAAQLPMFLLIVDRRVAFLPAEPDKSSIDDDFLVVHPSSLLNSLIALFESVWERASPLDLGPSSVFDPASEGDAPLTAEESRVLALLGAGMQDPTIAAQLGMGPRTVQRHVRHIMDALGTRTRFQTGVEANRRGWLSSGSQAEGVCTSN